MTDFCGRFVFDTDMNGDMYVSISDVWELLKQLWLIPSNSLASLFEAFPSIARFFEMDCGTGQGFGGFVFSLFVWLISLALLQEAITKIKLFK